MTLRQRLAALQQVHDGGLPLDQESYVELWHGAVRGITIMTTEWSQGADDPWLEFESRLWELGEEARSYLAEQRLAQGSSAVLDAFAQIAGDRELRRGRQPLVILLGHTGRGAYSDELLSLVDDPTVAGQALLALRLSGDGGHVSAVAPLVDTGATAAVQRQARMYVRRFGDG